MMTCFRSPAQTSEQVDRLRANQRVETVQRLVQHNDIGIVSDGLCQSHSLPHTLGVRRDFAGRGFGETDALERFPRSFLRLLSTVSEKKQPGGDEREPGGPARRGVVLRGVTGDPHQRFGIAR